MKRIWNGSWIVSFVILFCSGLYAVSDPDLQSYSPTFDPGVTGNIISDMGIVSGCLGKDILTLPEVIVVESKSMYSQWNNVWSLLMAGTASVIMHNSGADRDIADNFKDERILCSDMDKVMDHVGNPGTHFALTGIWYALSLSKGDQIGQQRAWTMFKALTITGATTLALKLARDNDTPNGKALAWPSGHTSSSFTVAAVLDEMYGPEVGVPAYLTAGFVGYRMMESGDHWASDVVFGAVLGYLVGHHVAGAQDWNIAGFDMVPLMATEDGRNAAGISFVKQF